MKLSDLPVRKVLNMSGKDEREVRRPSTPEERRERRRLAVLRFRKKLRDNQSGKNP